MPDSSKCFPLIRGRAMRVTRLDGCGAKVLGPTSTVVSKGFVTVTLTPNNDEGTAIAVTNANGDLCINDVPTPRFTGYTIEVAFCNVNPDLINIMTGNPIVMDAQATPQGVGFGVDTTVDQSSTGFALEVWSYVPSAACEIAGQQAYGYFLIPFAKGGTIGDISIGNAEVSFTVTGAQSKDGNAWGIGPYLVTRNLSGSAVALNTAIPTTRHLHLERVTVAPPTEVCGATALGVPATSIVAGIPSTSLPANSYMPLNLAGLTGVTASPATNWTSGQYVLLRDGSTANWNGTTWVAGIHA
jgi:hypothetical protein